MQKIAHRFTFIIFILLFLVGATLTSAVEAGSSHLMLPATITAADVTLHSGADYIYHIVAAVPQNESVQALARNPQGNWLFIWSENGDGWMPASQLRLAGDFSALPIWSVPMRHAKIKPTAILTENRAGIHSGADWGYHVVGIVLPSHDVNILGRNRAGDWLFIWSDGGDGWIHASKIETKANIYKLPVWNDQMNHAILKPATTINRNNALIRSGAGERYRVVGATNWQRHAILLAKNPTADWVFIWSDDGDGWVRRADIHPNADLDGLPVWHLPMKNSAPN